MLNKRTIRIMHRMLKDATARQSNVHLVVQPESLLEMFNHSWKKWKKCHQSALMQTCVNSRFW